MARASDKRIATANETALHNLRLGLLVVNLLAPTLRYLFSLVTSAPVIPSKKVVAIHFLTLSATLFIWRWFTLIGTPRRDRGGAVVRVGEDLGGKGVIDLAWDLIYMTWICTISSALLGDWIWWFLLLIPGFGAYKAFSILRPVLGMFLPNLFGPKAPQETAKEANDAQDGGQPSESKKQAKLRARAEKGDKRVQQQGQRR